MYRVVKIGDRDVPMLAMASANIYYKRVFGEDPIKVQADDDSTTGDNVTFAMQMAYIMATMAEAQGNRAQLNAMSIDGYIAFLDQFENGDYIKAVPDFMAVYNGQKNVTSTEKKE